MMISAGISARRPIAIFVALGVAVSMFMIGVASPAQALLPGPAPIEQRSATTATADNLPTVQIDSGVVWNQVVIGNVVYAGGSFSNTRPAGAAPGTNLTPRSNLLAYDIRTGNLTSFAPQINGTVRSLAVSPDGTRLYVGGSFNSVNGQIRWNLAAFDVATGALVSTFNAAVGGSYVNAIAVTDTTVYVAGLIGAGNGVVRKSFAAFNTNGGLLGWAPTSDLQVDAMVLTPQKDKLIAAGRFSVINGVSQRGMAALDLTTGALLPWEAPNIIKNGLGTGSNAGKAGIWSLTTDQNAVYGTGWVYADTSVGNLEGTFSADPETGDIRWIADCHGDHFGVYSDGTTVYTTSHEHACESAGGMVQKNPENMRNASALTAAPKGTLSRTPWANNIYTDWSGYPAPAVVDWYPDWLTGSFTGMGDAGYSIVGADGYIAVGGEFVGVNDQRQQGLVRFSSNPPGGPKQGPRLSGSNWTPGARSVAAGTARITIPANWDRDDLYLTYKLMRVGTAQPVATTTVESTYWNLPAVSLTDTGLQAGSTQSYYVVAVDPDGNSANSAQTSVQISNTSASPYVQGVLGDGPSLFWPLGGSASTAAADWAGTNDGSVGSGVGTTTGAGAIVGDTSRASTFNGTSNGLIATSQQATVGSSFSTELWFKTTTNSGGKLVGYGSSSSGLSSSYDRHVYMLNNGKLTFGTYPNAVKTVTSSTSYNDGSWHYLVAEQSAEGMKLFVDGSLVGSDSQTTTAQDYAGYWRLGGDNLSGWPNQPSSNYFAGSIDDFAVYGTALTSAQVASHYALGTGQGVPTALFTATPTALSVAVDASASTASSGKTIDSYSWNFGDGSPAATGVTATHSYTAPGTYTAVLTVTDSAGVPATTSQTVTVVAPHSPPTAVISDVVSNLSVSFDGTGSTASDGASVTGYAWDFGDGATSTEAKPVHVYAAAGPHTVTLTVTDDTGAASAAVTKSVTVTAPPVNQAPVAGFVASASGLTVSVDGSSSADSDGTVVSYAWEFGDGATGTGKTTTHAYTAAGTYTVKLTVTDNQGLASAAVTKSVTVTAPAANVLAQDAFARTVSKGWGAADVGGAWTLTGSTALFGVSGGTGQMALLAGSTRIATLDSVSSTDSDSVVTMALSAVPTGGGNYASVIGRQVGSSAYAVDTWIKSTGDVVLALRSGSTILNLTTVSGLTYTANMPLKLRVKVTGTSPTTISAKLWPAAQSEPASWQAIVTDNAAALQSAGSVGLKSYLSGAAAAAVTTSFDDYAVTTSDAVTPPAANVAPVAGFVASASGLTVSVDGSSSADSDGTVVSYAWEFGDGATGTGKTTTHAYTAAGTYTVKLTVTDNQGLASAAVTKSVTVTAPAANVLAQDAFARTVSKGWGAADVGGAWTLTGSTALFGVSGGTGQMALLAGSTRIATLDSVSSTDSDSVVTMALSAVPTGGGNYASVIGRQVGSSAYAVDTWIKSTGDVVLALRSGSTILNLTTVSGLTYTANMPLKLRVKVTGTSPTTISAKLWPAAQSEPASWQAIVTDNAAALQSAGSVGLKSYLSGAAAAAVTTSFDDYAVTTSDAVTPPAANVAPVAGFVASASGLTVSVDGSSSADSDGTVVSYAWEFGDGATGTGKTTTHAYTAAGTYTVKLTVTDNQGLASAAVTKSVTVTAPAANVAPVAGFVASASGLTVSVDGSSSADSDGTVVSYAWEFGDGATGTGKTTTHAYTAAGTYTVKLTVTDNQGLASAAVTKSVTVTAPPAAAGVPTPDHVVVVVMENHSSTNILGNADAPYINSLAASGASMTQSFAETHPSEPNYLALFSGSTQGLTGDDCPLNYTTTNIADQLAAAGKSFTGYAEGLPSVGYTGCQSGNYARKHSPWVNWASVPATANQPFTAFPTDYSTLPTLSYVIPNLQHDMHDGTIAQGDQWLQANLAGYVTWAQQHNSLLILTWDEDDNNDNNQIPTIILGQKVTPGQYSETINHYNVLRTLQDAFGLTPNDGSATATPITDIWS